MDDDARAHAHALHERAIVVNGLVSGAGSMPKVPDYDFRLPGIMRAGGVTAGNLTASITDDFETTLRSLSYLYRHVDADPGVRVARTADDIRAAKAEGGVAIVIGFQNSDPLEGRIENLEILHRLGLRIMQLTYQRRTLAADGRGEPANAGLSLYGRELVREMNRLGILLDLSHTGVQSNLETIELSCAPVAITHSCLQTFTPVARNATEEEAKLVAERGGVFGMNAIARLVSPHGNAEGATMAQFLDQVDHLVELLGIDHVGLGLDINEGLTPEVFEQRRKTFLKEFPELRMGGDFPFEHYYVFGLDSMARARCITEGLVERGYGDEDVLKILGGNFLRLFDEVWSVAAAAKPERDAAG